MPVVRISRGFVTPERFQAAESFIRDSQALLAPAIRQLPGCLHYYAGADPVSNTVVNVSVWRTMDDALEMESLKPMLELARKGAALGIKFERPVCNYVTAWEI
jgi:hypothetical protein